jgi:biotin carboxylase
LRSRYGLPGPGLDETTVGTNKLRMRQATAGAVRAPRAWSICSFLAMRPDEIGVKDVVIKPLHSSSSRGVRRMSVPAAYEWLAGAEEFYVVEEAVDVEQELHAEGLVVNGALAWLECSSYDRPVLLARRGVRTSLILSAADPRRESMAEMAQAVLTAMAVTTSVFHMEFLVQNGELHFGEVGLRPAGSGVSELLDLAVGSSVWEAHISAQVGVKPRGTAPTRSAQPLTGLVMARLGEDGRAPLAQTEAERLPGVIGTTRGTLTPGQVPPDQCSSEYSALFTGLDRAGLDDLIATVSGERA